MKIFLCFFKTFFFFILIINVTESNSEQNTTKNNQIKNDRTYSGPMGMGLSRSYDLNEHKICIYNTIEGQEKIKINKEIIECPKKMPE